MRNLLILFCFVTCPLLAQQPATMLAKLKTAPDNEKIEIYIALSQIYSEYYPDSAVYYANEGVRLAEKRNDHEGLAALLIELGHINALHHHSGLARRFYNEALSMYRRLHSATGIARTYDQLGLIDDPQAFNHALKYDNDNRDTNGLIETYESMGRALDEKGVIENALTYYLQALTLYEQCKQSPEAYFELLENIGRIYQKKGDIATALHYLQEGISNSDIQGAKNIKVHLLNAQGLVFEQANKPQKALTLYKNALAEAKTYNLADGQAEALIHIAGILKKQNAGASITDLQQALLIARNLNEPTLEVRIYQALAEVYRQQKNYSEAMEALDEHHRLLDSLLNVATIKELTALDSSYALESSREKISYLQEANREEKTELLLSLVLAVAVAVILMLLWLYLLKVKRLNQELTNSNGVKDTLFSVIGHDLIGPAGSTAQLFEMMETEDFSPEEMKAMIAELSKQTKASLELLQSLFEWGKAQLQGIKVRPSDFDPQPVIERCLSFLSQQATQKSITLRMEIPEGLLLRADPDHFEFIIRNLLSNAIKFSQEGDQIEVKAALSVTTHETIFAVKDSGVGISQAQQQVFLTSSLEVNFGTHREKGSGLGLLLTKDFIKANHGRIWLESQEGKGTTFYVALPAT